QFAGASAAMARAVGLPARVAVGFQHGILDGDGVYHVRGQDAHAWPEVYISGYGWLAFDDTPGRAGQVGEQNYDSVAPPPVQSTHPQSSQDTTTSSTAPGNQTPSTTEPPSPSDQGAQAQQHHHRSWWSRWWWVVVGLGLPTLGGSAMGAMILLRRQRWAARRAAATSAEARVLVAWEEAEEALALAGVARRPWETPREYADRAPEEAAVPARPLVDLAEDATAAAFSAAGVPDVVAARAEKSAASVKAELELGATRAERLRW